MSHAYSEFEEFVAGLACTILGPPISLSVGSGLRNRLVGASGVRHQIDVSFIDPRTTPPTLVLVECKHLNDAIKLAHVKIVKATVDDIQTERGLQAHVTGMLVSRIPAQKGAQQYAKHYAIDLQHIANQHEYDFAYDRWRVIARAAASVSSSHAVAQGIALRACESCGNQFPVTDTNSTCPGCGLTHSDANPVVCTRRVSTRG